MYPLIIILIFLCAFILFYSGFLRSWHRRWGARRDEIERHLPGDRFIPHPSNVSTRAVSVNAAPECLWAYLVQIGQGRGGLYSYERLENLIGCDIHNVEEIRPELQTLAVGEEVRLGPAGYPYYLVEDLAEGRHLLLKGPQSDGETHTWLFLIDPLPDGSSRLLVRTRDFYAPTFANFIIWCVMTEPLHFIMENKMLRTLKALAERG